MNDKESGYTGMIGANDIGAGVESSKRVDDQALDTSVIKEKVLPMSLATLESGYESRAIVKPPSSARLPLEVMLDVPITLIFEVGRTNITIKQLMEMCEGSYIELRNISVDSIDVRVSEEIIAQAETIALQQRYGIRFGEVEMIPNSGTEDDIS